MYSALQTGVVDAMEGSAEVGYTFKIFEVTKFLSLTRHILLDGSFAINAAFFNQLPKPQQDAVMRAAREAAQAQRAAQRAQGDAGRRGKPAWRLAYAERCRARGVAGGIARERAE